MNDILSGIGDLIKILANGVGNFVEFILNIPDLFYTVLNVVPDPFYSILMSFISIILFLFVAYAVAKLVSCIKGG